MSNLHKRQVYAGLFEIVSDPRYYYNSKVGSDYSHLTDEGVKAITEYINIMGPHMIKKEEEMLEARAKVLVWEGLKQ